MTVDEALYNADEWTRGCTFYGGSQGWRVAIATLAEEVRARRGEVEKLKEAVTSCTYPDCLSARAVRVAGDGYQRGYAEGLEKAAVIVVSTGLPNWAAVAQAAKDGIRSELAEAIRAATPVAEVCEWTKEEVDRQGSEFWKPSCGQAPTFYFCGPVQFYNFSVCPYCGKTLKVKPCP